MKKQSLPIFIGVLIATFSACKGKKANNTESSVDNSTHCECYGNNDTSSLCDPEESSGQVHRIESATDVSDIKGGEEELSGISTHQEVEVLEEVVVLEASCPVEISSEWGN